MNEIEAKLEKVRGWLRESQSEAILLASQEWFAWITAGMDSHVSLADNTGAAWVLVTMERAFLLAANNDLPRFRDEVLAGLPFEPVEWPWHRADDGAQLVAHLCNPRRTTSDLGKAGLSKAPPELKALRFTLLLSELDRYRDLGREAAEAVEEASESALPGQSELEIAGMLVGACRARDGAATTSRWLRKHRQRDSGYLFDGVRGIAE